MRRYLERFPRFDEYRALGYRLLLAYVFYMLARVLFFAYNSNLVDVNSVWEFVRLCYYGLAFDTTAILYTNSLFILLSIIPIRINTRRQYQVLLAIVYFVANLGTYWLNFVDFIYYRFTFTRLTFASNESLKHESNKMALLQNFLANYWHVFLLFGVCAWLWYYLYRRIDVKDVPKPRRYYTTSVLSFILIVTLCVGGIRGDFKKSTRPINLLDATRYTRNMSQGDLVLNSTFSFLRTFGSRSFRKVDYLPQDVVDRTIMPIKTYSNHKPGKPNIVIFILESFGREYVGSFNRKEKIEGYRGYTPFIDSLAQRSLIFTNGYANGHKSIHGMSSIIAGIPSFKEAFTSSPYPKQKIESLVSTLKGIGYHTSFYHGAPNGSMGFLGFSNILGYDTYRGKNEYGNDADFDGVWGIWDEPFFQFMKSDLDKTRQPFMATMFSVSSHEPYKVPAEYDGKFPEGTVNIHKTIGYTDYALKKFFESARRQPWFQNTIFVFVADHGNTIYYDEFKKETMRNTVPIMFYSPNHKWVGEREDYAQHIDIYPTLLDMIGYEKPFRSWGRSLLDTTSTPFVMRYSANNYQFFSGDYILLFDGQRSVGFYRKEDKALQNNLLAANLPEMKQMELSCKAFIQDYMRRIMDKKLTHE